MITVVTGKKNSGKSSFLLDWFNNDPRGVGALTVKRFRGKQIEGYDLLLLPSGKRINLCGLIPDEYDPDPDEIIMDHCIFDKYAFIEAKNYILDHLPDVEEPFWLDEISVLELDGEGFYPLLQFALSIHPEIRLGVNEACFSDLINWFDKKEISIIHFDDEIC